MRRLSTTTRGGRTFRRFVQWFLVAGFLSASLERLSADNPRPPGGKDDFTPEEIKAGILSKMLAYSINWPTNTLSPVATNLIVGVIGPDPIEKPLAALLKDRKVAGREVRVTLVTNATELLQTHVVFVPNGQKSRWEELKRSVVESGPLYGVLSVGERDDFLSAGGVIALYSEERKYKIDKSNARKAGLKLDSRLLDLERKMWAGGPR
jgi:hypothetical protein